MPDEFLGKGSPLRDEGFEAVGDLLGVRAPEIWAVLTVETRGCGFLDDRRPAILFERYVFHRQTQGKWDDEHSEISSSRAGGYVGGVGEYPRLKRAAALDRDAALRSASWGIGQVMGFNCESVGFDDVESMVRSMADSEDAQLLAMARFIESQGLASALRSHNWATFARVYNGPKFAENEYDSRLAGAHARFAQGTLPDLAVRRAQVLLRYLGLKPGPVDGLRGRFTRDALVSFQEAEGLPSDGELDAATEERLAMRNGL